MKNKCGILTLHSAINYGAYLQAFALQNVLDDMGYDTKIVDLENHKFLERILLIKCKHPKRVLYNYKLLKEFDKVYDQLKLWRGKTDCFDTIIIGSDELWNLNNSFKHRKEYFGENLNNENIISYAVSANKLTSREFRRITQDSVDFSKFNHISVRDNNTYKLVHDISDRDVALVMDPTFLLTSWKNYISPCTITNFILIYSFTVYEDEKRAIIEFARKTGKKIISVGSYNPWCDENICATPFEFLGYFEAADYVITSSFHGVVFSIIMHKKFVIYPQEKGKVLDLMRLFNLEELDVTGVEHLESSFDYLIDYQRIDAIKSEKVNLSLKWLRKALENE